MVNPPDQPPGSAETLFPTGPEVELLIDGKKAELVQSLVLSIDAETMLPVVFVKLIPGELDVKIETEGEFHAALSRLQGVFAHGLDGSFAPNPMFVPLDGAAAGGPGCPLPIPLTPEEVEKAQAEWNARYNPNGLSIEQLAGRLRLDEDAHAKLKAAPVGACGADIFGRPAGNFVPLGAMAKLTEAERAELIKHGWAEKKCCGKPEGCEKEPAKVPVAFSVFDVLDRMSKAGAHSEPIVLRVQDGKIVSGTLEEYQQKAKDPLPKVE